MTVVALVLGVALILTIGLGADLLRALTRQHARERDLLLNQLLHATGHTWTPPPAEEPIPVEPWEPRQQRYAMNVERYPTSYE